MKMSNNIYFDFRDKNVIVFGGSRGIGREICNQFSLSGANVYNASRTECDISTSSIKNFTCDISKSNQIQAVFDSLARVDFVINVAGTNLCTSIDNIEESEWDRLMNVNLKSFFLICKMAVEKMKKQNFGRIVNISSIAGRNKSIVSGVHYTSSKYGIVGLTKQLANETSKYNILVNCVCPSQTMTEMLQQSMTEEEIEQLENKIPIGRIASTKEQSLPVLFLCSDAASYITGTALDVNGGQL